MRKFLVLIWLMVPLLVGAYHYGPGQEQLLLDEINQTLREADELAEQEKYSAAVKKYEQALQQLPEDQMQERREIRVQRAKAQMLCSQLPQAHDDLRSLVEEMEDDSQADPQLLAEAREALANSRYYMTWLMRLEGEPRKVWEPEIEAARQTFRLLAEREKNKGNKQVLKKQKENLESAVRLARLDLDQLQGLPLPSQ